MRSIEVKGFRLTDDSAIVRTDYDDSEWRKLSLPI